MAEQPGDAVTDADCDQGSHDRSDRREQRAEGEPKHDQREDDPEHGAVGRLARLDVLDRLPGELDVQVRRPGRLGSVDDRVDRTGGEVLGLSVEVDGGEPDLPVPADPSAPMRPIGVGHADDAGQRAIVASIASTSVRTCPEVTEPVLASITI